jgi:hypothetical protein
VDKVRSLASAHWGMSTDFAKAMRKIAEMVCSERLEQHDVPDLLVVSEMQFDQAHFEGGYGDYFGYGKVHSAWDTVYEEIAQLFHEVGMQVHGRPLSAPNIIFWNVRADTYGYPAAADQKGVMLLSGYSPALMKFILSGEMEEEVAEALDGDGNVVKTRRQVDPREALRRVLNDSGLDAVRTVLELCLTSRGNPHEVAGDIRCCFARSQNLFCVSPVSIYFSVINLFLYTHCTVGTYQPARTSRTLPRMSSDMST